jgi:hypothetical protein
MVKVAMVRSASLALLLLLGASPAWAADFNDQTLCSALVAAASRQDHMDMRRAGRYIKTAFAQMDRLRVAAGHQPLMDIVTPDELLHMIRDTAATCSTSPTMTIYDAAKGVYITASMFGPG